MGVLSCLRPSLSRALLSSVSFTVKPSPQNVQAAKNLQYVVVRQMGGGGHGPPTMTKTPSRYVWNTLKDQLHFFAMLGLIPVALLITGVNMFIGQAELTDIPEGYQPHCWEYEKDPIKRFITKNVLDPYEKHYEKNMAFHVHDHDHTLDRRRLKKVRMMMEKNQDYKAWYYVPVDKTRVDKARLEDEFYEKEIKIVK